MTGFIICHKKMASELIETAAAVIGHKKGLFAFSNENISSEELLKQLQQTIQEHQIPTDQLIIMVDLRGGNCWAVAKKFSHGNGKIPVLSGVNLPMIFSFLTKSYNTTAEELAKVLETDAHRGVFLEF
ncbi:MAG: hypothetical protein Kow0037_08600 [Calditrichia bacterium]